MLNVIEFSNDKSITFVCPCCHKIFTDGRIDDDPPDTYYGIMPCSDCQGDDNDEDPIIYYDKYGYLLKISDES